MVTDPGATINQSAAAELARAASVPVHPLRAGEGTGKSMAASAPEQVSAAGKGPCRTCAERRYQDVSDDPSVSFQTPTAIAPEQAASAVRAHEQEHVTNNAARAEREGMDATSSVTIHTDLCPECGRVYVAGGTTMTTYTRKVESALTDDGRGLMLDVRA